MPTITQLAKQGHGFAVFPEVRLFDKPGGKSIQHLIFGDFITPPKLPSGKYKKWSNSLVKTVSGQKWIQARSRQEEGWMRLEEIRLERTLEINFVDIGQGDGCHLVTPGDEHFIIDAGEQDNMYRFLRWRFNLSKPGAKLPKFTAIMSHPDQDHWKGFEPLLSKPPVNQVRQIEFDRFYYNGILQRTGSSIGGTVKKNKITYLKDFIQKQEDLQKQLDKPGAKSNLEKFFIGALTNFPGLKLETVFRNMGEERTVYKDDQLTLQVLAPIPEKINGKMMLRWFDPDTSQIGKTKNGHSIVVMARIGKMKIMLGGDLNSESADYLMSTYAQKNLQELRLRLETCPQSERAAVQEELEDLVAACREVFGAEIAKSCHHGSSDITNEFLQAVHPIATVISSGDEESHFHPRPETLGAIGKYGRGNRPLIFSTELGRSSPEFVEFKQSENPSDKKKQKVVSTYGLVTVRTDGTNAIISQKLEKARSSFGLITKWHVDKIIWNEERGEFISRKELIEKKKKTEE